TRRWSSGCARCAATRCCGSRPSAASTARGPSPAKAAPKTARSSAARGNPLLRIAAIGGEHGLVTFPSKAGSKTVAFERGTVKSVSGSTFTVRAPDGTTWTWKVIATTKMRQDGQTVVKPKVSSGDTVFVEGLASGGVNQA